MDKANFEFNMNQTNPWSNLSTGAKVATALAGLAIAAASVAASIFLAGAALFAGIVFVAYEWISGKSKNSEPENTIIEGELAEADK